MEDIYCLKCKKKTETINTSEIITKNNRRQLKGQCKICSTKKSQFISSNKILVGSGIDPHLDSVYYDPKQGFSGINDLQRKTGKSQKEVEEFLHQQDTYTKHHPIKKNFKRERVYVQYPDQQWQADLAFMVKYSRENKGHKYFLSVIDCFSKYAWTFPLKNKKPEGIVDSFNQIFKESGRKPERLQVDEGKEFMGKFSKENKINKFSTQNRDIKACIAERFNRTIEEKIEKVLTENDNNKWISILPDLMINYNNSYHSSIKMTPVEASKKENTELVYKNLFPEDKEIKIKKPRYKIGDTVRTKINKKVFDKGYEQNFSDDVRTICKIYSSKPVTYQVKDSDGRIIKGRYYEEELVNKSETS
jgi:hypothetical protein